MPSSVHCSLMAHVSAGWPLKCICFLHRFPRTKGPMLVSLQNVVMWLHGGTVSRDDAPPGCNGTTLLAGTHVVDNFQKPFPIIRKWCLWESGEYGHTTEVSWGVRVCALWWVMHTCKPLFSANFKSIFRVTPAFPQPHSNDIGFMGTGAALFTTIRRVYGDWAVDILCLH